MPNCFEDPFLRGFVLGSRFGALPTPNSAELFIEEIANRLKGDVDHPTKRLITRNLLGNVFRALPAE